MHVPMRLFSRGDCGVVCIVSGEADQFVATDQYEGLSSGPPHGGQQRQVDQALPLRF